MLLEKKQVIVVIFVLSTCACAQQSANFLPTVVHPYQYGDYSEDSSRNRYNINPSYGIRYYATTTSQLPLPLHLPLLPTPSPVGYLTSPFQEYGSYGRDYSTTIQALSDQNNRNHQLNHQQKQSQQHQDTEQKRRVAPQIVQQQRNKGNFYRQLNEMQTPSQSATAQRKYETQYNQQKQQKPQQQDQVEQKLKLQRQGSKIFGSNAGYAVFEHKVFHVTTPLTPAQDQDFRERRSSSPNLSKLSSTNLVSTHNETSTQAHNAKDAAAFPSKAGRNITDLPTPHPQEKARLFHDIFMHYSGPQSVAFGHVDHQPLRFAHRFESLNKGNRYRGEVTWADSETGGYGSQYWDLAQGKV